MAKKSANESTTFNNNWEALIAKPEVNSAKKNYADNEPDPFYQKREDTYYGMFPSDAGEKYAFAIVPAENGDAFLMTDIATIQRHRFTSPKDGKHYFENLKMPMDPKKVFDYSVMDKLSDPNSLTDEDKKTLAQIKRHGELMQRYKNLQYCKVENVNFGFSQKPNLYSSRLKKQSLTAFFGVWTKWKGAVNTHGDRQVKLISTGYGSFQDKFRALLKSTYETHNELQPTWLEDYFSSNNGVKGVIDVTMGSMKVGGEGASIKLIKVGKDPIDDKGAGITGPIEEKDVVTLPGDENRLSHLHYYMGMKSDGPLFHDAYADRFEEALSQLEAHVEEMKLKNLGSPSSATAADSSASNSVQGQAPQSDDVPF